MILKVFSVRDGKGEFYGQPFYAKTLGEAERSFRMLANDDKSMPWKFPEDFDLYEIGEFDDNSGKLKGLETPRHMSKAINLKEATH